MEARGRVIVGNSKGWCVGRAVPYAFGLCGHGNIQFIDALHERQSDIKALSLHHESVCSFTADAYYRVKGQPATTHVVRTGLDEPAYRTRETPISIRCGSSLSPTTCRRPVRPGRSLVVVPATSGRLSFHRAHQPTW